MKRALLTGASGFLGKYISHALIDHGYDVISIGRAAANSVSCDLAASIPDFNSQIDLVVHAMGKAHVIPTTVSESQDFFQVNVQGTKNLCTSLERLSNLPHHFVFISSVAVYGLEEGIMVDEDAELKGATPYAKSKIEAEKFLSQWCERHAVTLTILRLPLVAGKNPPGNLGAMIDGIRSGKYFNIKKGTARKSMVLARDVATAIIHAATVGGIYNLTDGYHPSFAELAAVISKQLGKSEPMNLPTWIVIPAAYFGNILGAFSPINVEKLKKITATLTFDDRKAQSAFEWQPSKVLDELLV